MWKKIREFPQYFVNERGEIFSLHTNKVLKPSKSGGYLRVILIKDGRRRCLSVHRLVADAFLDNPHKLPCINHKDENKLNNDVTNLEWCTYQYNNTYNQRHLNAGTKLKKPVTQFDLNGNAVKTYKSAKEASEATGIRKEWIARTARGERKTCKGFVWKWAKQAESLRIR